MSTELAIIRQENIQTIVSAAPESYRNNSLSRAKCAIAGQRILDAITSEGMTDNLDQQAALYIEKARKTVKKMNERRAPVTKLFDEIRKEFTAIENAIDPTKADTIPYKLQVLRNQYAAKKRAEEEERRRREYERRQAEVARTKLRQDIEDDFRNRVFAFTNKACAELSAIDDAITLESYDASQKQIEEYPEALPSDFLEGLHTLVSIPAGVSADEVRAAEAEIKTKFGSQYAETYAGEVISTKQYLLARLPSKKSSLERMLQASKEESSRIKEAMEARKGKDSEEQEAERRRKEENARKNAEIERMQTDMEGLFNQQAVMQDYQPKVKVSQKINILNPEGIMPIFSMWWREEGCNLSVDELKKIFKKQISFCEKLADKSDIYIKDENIEYVEDVKSK